MNSMAWQLVEYAAKMAQEGRYHTSALLIEMASRSFSGDPGRWMATLAQSLKDESCQVCDNHLPSHYSGCVAGRHRLSG
jgi:hypothetical protein